MQNPRYIKKRSRSGVGLSTTIPLKRGARVIEYTGEKITTEEADRRGGKYIFTLNRKWTIDGKGRENLARYINHSCKPNCCAEVNTAETHIYIFARRAIAQGEELTYNYGKDHFNAYIKPLGCRCTACTKKSA